MNVRRLACALLFLATWWCAPTLAQTRLLLGHAASSEVAGAFVAAGEGFFKEADLQLELQLIPLAPSMPPALSSRSIHIAAMTSTTFVQAVDGGLDLVVIAEGSVGAKTSKAFAAFARQGSGIQGAQDFVGKKVAVPGIGAILHVWFRKWLAVNGVDPRRVTFVEGGFPQHADLIRGGSVDAVITLEPMLTRMQEAGIGYVVTSMVSNFELPLPIFYYVSTRDFANANPDVVTRFRESLRRGVAFAEGNPERTKTHIARFTGLPAEMVARIPMPQLVTASDQAGLVETVKMMREQGMLRSNPEVARLYAQ